MATAAEQPTARAPIENWDDFSRDFGFPQRDSVFYWNRRGTRPHMPSNWPDVNLWRLRNDWRAPGNERSLGGLLVDQIFADSFAIVLSNHPRLAFVYDIERREVRGINDEGVFHLGFNFSAEHNFLFATRNSWKRLFGYNDFYDWLSHNTFDAFYLDSRRVIFEYDGLEIMVQLWKGTYAFHMATGSEVGFYYRPLTRRLEHWDVFPLSRAFPMSMRLTAGDIEYFDLPPIETWWIVMSQLSEPTMPARYQTLEWTGDFTNEPGLGEAFYLALQAQHPDISVTRNGNSVSLVWAGGNA